MYKLLLCLRYLRTRYIALASVISVMLGVATMIVVNSVMAGFSTEMQDRIKGILADIIIECNDLDGTPDAEKQLAIVNQIAGEHIQGMTATVEIYGMVSFQYAGQWITRPVQIVGIQPDGKAKVGPLVDYLESYNETKGPNGKVRPPQRSREELPSWNLTQDAREYRELIRSQQFYQPPRLPPMTIPGMPQTAELPPQPREVPTFDELPEFVPDGPREPLEAPRPVEPKAGVPDFDEVFPPAAELHRLQQAPISPEVIAQQLNPVDLFPPVAAEEDPSQPLDARVYMGIGLVSFPVKDPKTGKVHTVMMVNPGDDVKLSTVTAGRPPNPVHFNATVVDMFKCGMSEYDANLVYCNLEQLQKVRGMINPETKVRSITSIQIKLKNYDDAPLVVEKLREAFPPGLYTVRTWEQKQGPLLAAVEMESAILNVLLFLIIAVAGFGILAIFFMIVVEKTKDIGILKALGASSHGIMGIFLSYGLGLGIVGSGVGTVLGLLFVRYINEIEDALTALTGRKVFDETIYYFPEIPTSVSPMMVFWVSLGALIIAVLASILPARRAANLHPVESLRYE